MKLRARSAAVREFYCRRLRRRLPSTVCTYRPRLTNLYYRSCSSGVTQQVSGAGHRRQWSARSRIRWRQTVHGQTFSYTEHRRKTLNAVRLSLLAGIHICTVFPLIEAPASIRDPASIKTNEVRPPACNWDPASTPCPKKKTCTKLMAVTLSFLNRFSKFFHWHTQR